MNSTIKRRVAALEKKIQINNNGEPVRELTEVERSQVKFFKEIHSINGDDERIFYSEQYKSWDKTLSDAIEERLEMIQQHEAEKFKKENNDPRTIEEIICELDNKQKAEDAEFDIYWKKLHPNEDEKKCNFDARERIKWCQEKISAKSEYFAKKIEDK